MSEELLINVSSIETRVALIDGGLVQDIYIERPASRGIVGNIYTGKVVRVLPGMQAAFVDIGAQRTGYLHLSDLSTPGHSRSDDTAASKAIGDYLHEGKKITVQVSKAPVGSKGARLTTVLSVSARHLVLMPQTNHIGVSQRIGEASERSRLQQVLAQALVAEDMTEAGGFILRTAAEGAVIDEIRADLRYLKRLWGAISRRGKAAQRPAMLYEDLALQYRAVRDLAGPRLSQIHIDDWAVFGSLKSFCEDYVPELAPLLVHCGEERALFDRFGVEREIELALQRKVLLKSGGYLVVDQTEAMTTIDVNTGSFVGRKNLEETIYKTNLEAAEVVARQLRLRNIGGIIIVDFIDMVESEHRREVHRVLERSMQFDPVRNKIATISELGLLEMTRKRSRDSLEHLLCEECSECGGSGVVKSAQTLCYEIFREIMRDAPRNEDAKLMILAAQAVVDRLLDEDATNVVDLEEMIGITISFRVETGFSQEQFDIVIL